MNERTAMHEPERKSAGGIHGSFQHIYEPSEGSVKP